MEIAVGSVNEQRITIQIANAPGYGAGDIRLAALKDAVIHRGCSGDTIQFIGKAINGIAPEDTICYRRTAVNAIDTAADIAVVIDDCVINN